MKELNDNMFKCLGDNTKKYIGSSVAKRIRNKKIRRQKNQIWLKFIDSSIFMSALLQKIIFLKKSFGKTSSRKCINCNELTEFVKSLI